MSFTKVITVSVDSLHVPEVCVGSIQLSIPAVNLRPPMSLARLTDGGAFLMDNGKYVTDYIPTPLVQLIDAGALLIDTDEKFITT